MGTFVIVSAILKKKRTCGKLGHGPEKKGAGLKNSYMINCYNLNIY